MERVGCDDDVRQVQASQQGHASDAFPASPESSPGVGEQNCAMQIDVDEVLGAETWPVAEGESARSPRWATLFSVLEPGDYSNRVIRSVPAIAVDIRTG
ncbi:hypothetical protein [Microtetraspora malaysiensis]|uniref:hypothetical protein n=1 Tax=Microtetraspora malaysiensis TaxID=161358 RepID=UPI00082B58D0|nr:hypothetical protein [Microtetraspora malaysiensis]